MSKWVNGGSVGGDLACGRCANVCVLVCVCRIC